MQNAGLSAHSLSAIVSEAWTKLAESRGAANSGSGQELLAQQLVRNGIGLLSSLGVALL